MPKAPDLCIFCDEVPCVCNKKPEPKKKVYVPKKALAKPDTAPVPDPTPAHPPVKERRMTLEQIQDIREQAELKQALRVLAPILHPDEQIRHGLPRGTRSPTERASDWKTARGTNT